jgi:hypothetical protein
MEKQSALITFAETKDEIHDETLEDFEEVISMFHRSNIFSSLP